jgi:peptidyl-prolyl cis-trans isomerase A (cyclophilin A)
MRRTTWMVGMLMVFAAAIGSGCHASGNGETAAMDDGAPAVRVRMETTKGDIVVELDREHAPISVANFLKYADRGDYDGTIFHRVMENFVIQGGGWTPDPHDGLVERARLEKEKGHPDVPIKNEWHNGLKNSRGTIAMARETDPDSATREFYINVQDNPKLDTPRDKTGNAGYAVFGRVVEGMDVVDAIRRVPTKTVNVTGVDDGSMENVPVEPVLIRKVQRVK